METKDQEQPVEASALQRFAEFLERNSGYKFGFAITTCVVFAGSRELLEAPIHAILQAFQ